MSESETILLPAQPFSPFLLALRNEIIEEYRLSQADEADKFRRALEEIADQTPHGPALDRRRQVALMGNIARRALNLPTLY